MRWPPHHKSAKAERSNHSFADEFTSAPRSSQSSRSFRGVIRLLVCGVAWGCLEGNATARTPPPKLQINLLADQTAADLIVTGQAGTFLRLEVSSDLLSWAIVTLLTNSNGVVNYIEPLAVRDTARFYRARQVQPVTGISGLDHFSGGAGLRIEITGQFFFPDKPKDNVVTIGGVPALVQEVTATRIVAIVPEAAVSGVVRVTTPRGTAEAPGNFVVTKPAQGRFDPPPGLAPADFEIGTAYGLAKRGSTSEGAFLVTVREGVPLIMVAAPKDTNDGIFFFAVTLSAEPPVTLNTASTAETLVFMNPLLMTLDPSAADAVLSIIREDGLVRRLAQVLNELFPQGGQPFTHPTFTQAYSNAVSSVLTNQSLVSLAREIRQTRRNAAFLKAGLLWPSWPEEDAGGRSPGVDRNLGKASAVQAQGPAVSPRKADVYEVDLDFIRVINQSSDPEMKLQANQVRIEGFPFNPVDWAVVIQEMDFERAFPNGRIDFQAAYQNGLTSIPWALQDSFRVARSVTPDFFFSRFSLVTFLINYVSGKVDEAVVDKTVSFPDDQDAIFVVRGFGPAFDPESEEAFALEYYSKERYRILFINAMNAAMDLVSAVIDLREAFLGEVPLQQEFVEKTLAKFNSGVPGINDLSSFFKFVSLDLATFIVDFALDQVRNKASELAGRSGKVLFKSAGETLTGFLRVLDIIAAIGQVAERASGLVRTTPTEEAFIMVGDVFRLDILSVEPAGIAPGENAQIVIQRGRFDPQRPKDKVYFAEAGYEGTVSAVEELGEGKQRLTVRLPTELQNLADGEQQLLILARGKRGESKFRLANRPLITGMSPLEGFAATEDFLGQPFPGTPIALTGVGFSRTNRFVFTGGAEGTNKSASTSNVTVRVPKQAASGPITIQRQVAPGDVREGTSPPFTVLGAPIIEAILPTNGPVGTEVVFAVRNVGSEPSVANVIRVQFAGAEPEPVRLLGGGRFRATVPLRAESGPISVLTPAGQAQSGFTVLPGRAAGSRIVVGGDSVIDLATAINLATGKIAPQEDDDDGPSDPPWEQGDFIFPDRGRGAEPRFLVGEKYTDSIEIVGEVTLDLTLGNEFAFDALGSGILKGTVLVTGDNIKIGGLTIRGTNGQHGLVIRGNQNSIGVICEDKPGDGVRIEGGKNNQVGIIARGNGGNGLILTGGAFANDITFSNVKDNRETPRGNGGHGILLTGIAVANIIDGSASLNAGDGVRLEGDGVKDNLIRGSAFKNRGNGYTIINGPSGTLIAAIANANAKSGIALIGGASSPIQTRIEPGFGGKGVDDNADYGILVSGVQDAQAQTFLHVFGKTNRQAGLRLENGTRGIQIEAELVGGMVGLELDGAGVTGNNVDEAFITGTSSNGVRIVQARDNDLKLAVEKAGATGIVLDGAKQNRLSLTASKNSGDGVLLTGEADHNRIEDLSFGVRENSGNGLVIENGSKDNTVVGLVAFKNQQHGVLVRGSGTTGTRFYTVRSVIGLNGGDGFRFEGGASNSGVGTDAGGGYEFLGNAGAGIRIVGRDTTNQVILGCVFSSFDPSLPSPEAGIIVEDGASGVIIGGFTAKEQNTFTRNKNGIVVRGGARQVVIQHNLINGHSGSGVLVDNAESIFIGGKDPRSFNDILRCATAVEIQGPGARECQVIGNHLLQNTNGVVIRDDARQNIIGIGNLIRLNHTGVLITGAHSNLVVQNTIQANAGPGIYLSAGAHDNEMQANAITGNGNTLVLRAGVEVQGPATIRNALHFNSITGNGGKGIGLIDGGNGLRPAPVINAYDTHAVFGTAAAPNGATVEIFKDSEDEGREPMASGFVFSGRFRVPLELDPAQVGAIFQLTGTIIDPAGNTSEFGQASPPPLFAASPIVFSSRRDGHLDLYLQDGFTFLPTRVTSHAADDFSPSFSPDGQHVVFVSTRDGNSEIYTQPARAGALAARRTTHPGADYDPAWSPDGAKLVFVSERDGNPELYLMNTNGTGLVRLTDHPGTDRSPAFSPDGTRIAFSSNRAGNFEVFLMNADGSNPQRLTSHVGADFQPAWSGDGQWIAFVSDRDGNFEIYLVKPEGTELRRITNHPATDEHPAWLAGGGGLVFASNRDEGFELYLIGRMGEPVSRLTISEEDNLEPHAIVR